MSTQAERLQSHTWALGTTTAPLGPMMPFGPNGLTLSIVTRVRCLPALAPGRHLTRVTIDSVNPFGPKGIIGPNGAVVVPRAQVWDWSRSAWVDIDYQDNASSPVPDAAIQPSTG